MCNLSTCLTQFPSPTSVYKHDKRSQRFQIAVWMINGTIDTGAAIYIMYYNKSNHCFNAAIHVAKQFGEFFLSENNINNFVNYRRKVANYIFLLYVSLIVVRKPNLNSVTMPLFPGWHVNMLVSVAGQVTGVWNHWPITWLKRRNPNPERTCKSV